MRKRGRRIALLLAAAAAGTAAMLLFTWGDIAELYHAMRTGYRFVWMPENVAPAYYGCGVLNDAGQVAVDITDGRDHGWSEAGRWSLRERTALPARGFLPAEERTRAIAIDRRGVVLGGTVQIVFGVLGSMEPVHPERTFLWSPEEGMRPGPGALEERLAITGVNNTGQVAGITLREPHRAFTWNAETGLVELEPLAPGAKSYAVSINDLGWVLGNAETAGGLIHPVLWKPGAAIIDLGVAPGYFQGSAVEINASGTALV
jgi:probable HAF family extracellular repeat protein